MTCLIGVDLGVRKVALAVFLDGRLYEAQHFEVNPEIVRPWQLLELGRFVSDHAVLYGADALFIEDIIIGNNAKYSIGLAEVMGAVTVSCAHRSQVMDIRTVNNKTWKKEMVGDGNASKEQVRNYIVATHPDYAPLCEDEQDRYDACCIGLYGLRIIARARDLRLVEHE